MALPCLAGGHDDVGHEADEQAVAQQQRLEQVDGAVLSKQRLKPFGRAPQAKQSTCGPCITGVWVPVQAAL